MSDRALPDRIESQDEQAHAEPSLRYERRCLDRWPMRGSARAVCVGGDAFGRLFELKLSDCSADGLGACCDDAITPGSVVSVGFSSPGSPIRQAVVLRCQPCGAGYRVGMQFALRAAA